MNRRKQGHCSDSIVIDPGIGFGKTTAHNLALLRATQTFERLARHSSAPLANAF